MALADTPQGLSFTIFSNLRGLKKDQSIARSSDTLERFV